MDVFSRKLEASYRRALAEGKSPAEAREIVALEMKEFVLDAARHPPTRPIEDLPPVKKEEVDAARRAAAEARQSLEREPAGEGIRSRAEGAAKAYWMLVERQADQLKRAWEDAETTSGAAFSRFSRSRVHDEKFVNELAARLERNQEFHLRMQQKIKEAFDSVPREEWSTNAGLKARAEAIDREVRENSLAQDREIQAAEDELTRLRDDAFRASEHAGVRAREAREAADAARQARRDWESIHRTSSAP